jgi:hypothetical protein
MAWLELIEREQAAQLAQLANALRMAYHAESAAYRRFITELAS